MFILISMPLVFSEACGVPLDSNNFCNYKLYFLFFLITRAYQNSTFLLPLDVFYNM